jgi:hypothetical protein
MQGIKTAKYIKAAQHEQSAGDAECHRGATVGNDLLRVSQLVLRHGFAFAYFIENRFGAPIFFAYRSRRSVFQPLHVYSTNASASVTMVSRPNKAASITPLLRSAVGQPKIPQDATSSSRHAGPGLAPLDHPGRCSYTPRALNLRLTAMPATGPAVRS